MKRYVDFVRSIFALLLLTHGVSGLCKEIIVGHVAGFSGAVAKEAGSVNLGAKILFDAVNDLGGVGGQKIRLVLADDKYNPESTQKEALGMVGKVSALLPTVGPRNLQILLDSPELASGVLPIVGSIPSRESIVGGASKNLFHIRASDSEQIEKIVQHLLTIGIDKIGLVEYRNPNRSDSVGDVERLLNTRLKRQGLTLAGLGKYDLKPNPDFSAAIASIIQASPKALIVIGPPQLALHPLLKLLKSRNIKLPIYALSYMDARALTQELGDYAKYVVITQVFPNLRDTSLPLIKEFRANYLKYSKSLEPPTFYVLEGYVSAKLIVEAIRLSKDGSAQGVRNGLESMRNFDLGGYIVDFSNASRRGSHFTTLSIVDMNGDLKY